MNSNVANNYSQLDAVNSNLNIPLLNSVFSSFRNNNQQSSKEKNSEIIKEYSLELRDKEELIRNFEIISKDLIIMGFAPQLVLHSFLAYKYKTTEEAIEILSKSSEGLWNHKHIAGEDRLCFVCDTAEDQHRNIRRITLLPKRNSLENKKLDELILEKKISFAENKSSGKSNTVKISLNSCQICLAEINLDEQKYNLMCQHNYCKECIIEYIKEEIKNARVLDIKCPTMSCPVKFSSSQIKNLCSDEMYYKYQKFLQRIKIKDDNSLLVCPIVDCEGFAKKEQLEDNLVSIPNEDKEIVIKIDNEQNKVPAKRIKYTCNNGHSFCSVCSQAWHGDSECDVDKEIKDFATYSGFILKKCVQCKAWTEKNEGCNHMTCKICSFNWCWLCEKECPPQHYFIEGTPCYGKQFNNQETNPEEMRLMLMLNDRESFFVKFFIFYIITFYIMESVFRVAANADRTCGKKIVLYLCIVFTNLVIALISLIFNGFIFITMLTNLSRINTIRNPFANLMMVLTFIVLFFLFYIIGGPALTAIWFVVANLYALGRTICL
jgi:hypothetical protein